MLTPNLNVFNISETLRIMYDYKINKLKPILSEMTITLNNKLIRYNEYNEYLIHLDFQKFCL